MNTYKKRVLHDGIWWYHEIDLFTDNKFIGTMTMYDDFEISMFIKEWSDL